MSIREDNEVGDGVSIGTSAVLEFGNRIGHRVRIHTGCFLELVTIEDDVFVGPNVVFTDDLHPMNCPHYRDCLGGAVVRRRARIGANSTILPGVEIGADALVGAGSVVVDDVLRSAPGVERLDAWKSLPALPRGEGPDVRLWPHVHGTDGMYVALLRRAPGASSTGPGAVAS